MASLKNICIPIQDQGMWRTLRPVTVQPLSGIRVVSSCESRNLYPISRLTCSFQQACLILVCGMFSLHILLTSSVPSSDPSSDPSSSLCACGRAANTSVSCVCVANITQRFHISRLIGENTLEIDPDCKLTERSFPWCHF